jgi:glutathione synthetase
VSRVLGIYYCFLPPNDDLILFTVGEHSRGMEWGRHARNADKLGIQRSDYMLHKETTTSSRSNYDGAAAAAAAVDIGGCYSLKQVELNTIASSFAGLASTVARMHRFLTQRLEGELQQFLGENERAVMGTDDDDYVGGSKNAILGASPSSSSSMDDDCILGIAERGVPESPAMTRIPSAIAVAYDRYCTRFDTNSAADATNATFTAQPTVLFVVQPKETNTVDQRLLEFALWNNHKIPVVRMSLAEIYDKVTLDEESGRLTFMDGSGDGGCSSKREVAVVYFRAGYAPTDYPSGYNTKDGTGVEWLARERLERGVATKCPCLGYHLAGTKKVQQELARPGVVEHFFPENDDGDSAAAARLIRTAFAGLYSLGADANDEDMKAVKEVLLHDGEGRYVLKPQREGGGYNFYGKQLADKLRSNCTITTDHDDVPTIQLGPALSEFILMERLFPPQQRAILLRNGRVEGCGMTISELGCFGTIVVSGEGDVVHNEYAGFLLRTKFSGVDEGGVASGFATLSSPYLC